VVVRFIEISRRVVGERGEFILFLGFLEGLLLCISFRRVEESAHFCLCIRDFVSAGAVLVNLGYFCLVSAPQFEASGNIEKFWLIFSGPECSVDVLVPAFTGSKGPCPAGLAFGHAGNFVNLKGSRPWCLLIPLVDVVILLPKSESPVGIMTI
jgi:hypothetical protein